MEIQTQNLINRANIDPFQSTSQISHLGEFLILILSFSLPLLSYVQIKELFMRKIVTIFLFVLKHFTSTKI